MANLKVLDGDGAAKYMKESGAGTDGDPHVGATSIAAGGVAAGAIVDGADLSLGAIADASVVAGATGSVSAKLRRISTDIDAIETELKVKADPTEAQLVNGGGTSVITTLTVTSGLYSVADVVGGLITITNAARANASLGRINSVKLSGVSALEYQLWFFNADIATPALDNAAFALAAADGAKFLGQVDIVAANYMAAQTAFNCATKANVGIEYKTGAATTSIYAYLVAKAVTTPGTTTLYLTVDCEWIN